MRKTILGLMAAAAIAAPIATATAANASGAPVTQTSTVMVPTPRHHGRPARAEQPVHQDDAHPVRHRPVRRRGQVLHDLPRRWRYRDRLRLTDGSGDGDLLGQGSQVGTVLYRTSTVVRGADSRVPDARSVNGTDGKAHQVQVAYNDRPGSYGDNSGSLNLNVVRVKV